MWKKVKSIFLNARDCKDGSRDENAWCDDVVRPLVYLAMDLYGNGKWVVPERVRPLLSPSHLKV